MVKKRALGKDICTVKQHAKLEKLNKELTRVDQLKSDIIMNVSHELRTPLTVASSSIMLASKNCSKEQRQLMNRALQALKRQDRTIENLVEASLTAKEKFRMMKKRTDLAPIIMAAMDDLLPVAQYKEAQVIAKIPKLKVNADKKELRHVMRNLIDNAIKFSKPGSKVLVTAKKMKDSIKIMVKDDGVGVSKRYHKKIFDKLYQIDSSATRKYGGTGMGLARAKRIILAHDGKIWVISTKGKGATFCVNLPK